MATPGPTLSERFISFTLYPSNHWSQQNKPPSHLVLPVVVVLDEVQDEVEDVFGTEVLDVSELSHGYRHGLGTDQTQLITDFLQFPRKLIQIFSAIVS